MPVEPNIVIASNILISAALKISKSLYELKENILGGDRHQESLKQAALKEVHEISSLLNGFSDTVVTSYPVEHIEDFRKCISTLKRAQHVLARPRKKYFLLEVRQRDERILSSLLADLRENKETLSLLLEFE
jgi:hypothetical protein